MLESGQGLYKTWLRPRVLHHQAEKKKKKKNGFVKLDELMLSISCETIKDPYSSRFQSGTSLLKKIAFQLQKECPRVAEWIDVSSIIVS